MEEKKLKNIAIAMSVVVILLIGGLVWVVLDNKQMTDELIKDKEELLAQFTQLDADFQDLSSDYDTINSQLDSSREQVTQLIERLKNTEAKNRSRIRQYEKELGTLRSIMRGYIVQIDSLNTLNKKLTADAAAARKDAAESRRKSEELSKTVETLSSQVAEGSVIKCRNLYIEGRSKADKRIDRSSRVVRFVTSLSLIENDLAPKGPVRVYIRVKGPDGILITNGSQKTFEVAGEPLICSASREVDYQGKEVDMTIYLNDLEDLTKGIYTVEAYTTQGKLGQAEVMLR